MNDLTTVFIALAWAAIGIFLTWQGRSKVSATLKKSFVAHVFDTPAGRVTGEALRVVKVSKQFVRFAGDDVYRLGKDWNPADTFWYCVGPGPSYFLAIAMVTTGFGKVSVQWIVRPLSEDRMRGALICDKKATALAFGNAVEG